MMESEMDEHLGYEAYERSENPNYRNGYKTKKLRSKYGEVDLSVPQDRESTFEPKIVPKAIYRKNFTHSKKQYTEEIPQ